MSTDDNIMTDRESKKHEQMSLAISLIKVSLAQPIMSHSQLQLTQMYFNM